MGTRLLTSGSEFQVNIGGGAGVGITIPCRFDGGIQPSDGKEWAESPR
jgi:hypothetical protein